RPHPHRRPPARLAAELHLHGDRPARGLRHYDDRSVVDSHAPRGEEAGGGKSQMTPRRFRVAVIGRTGKGNYGHGLDTVWNQIDIAEVVDVADPDDKGRAAAAARTKAQAAYAD